jgi:hypothetical protein
MPFSTDNEWTIIDPIPTQFIDMASTSGYFDAPTPEAEYTNNTKPAKGDENTSTECNCSVSQPKLVRNESVESIRTVEDDWYAGRRTRRRRPISPVPQRAQNAMLNSSVQLLAKVNKYDGIADLPFPARGGIYLTTFPFTDRDVKKWSWLFSLGIEDTFLAEDVSFHDCDSEDERRPRYRPVQRRRDRSPEYDSYAVDISSVCLSRALDTEVVPEGTDGLRYVIVIKNRHRPAGSKLLVGESRKAAGMLMYYELLKGDSVMFVGAMMGPTKNGTHPKKFRKVESVGEAGMVQQEGFVGVVC